jgi:hypothetical protein
MRAAPMLASSQKIPHNPKTQIQNNQKHTQNSDKTFTDTDTEAQNRQNTNSQNNSVNQSYSEINNAQEDQVIASILKEEIDQKKRRSAYVRFNESEWKEISDISRETGKGRAELLKEKFFSKKIKRALMHVAVARSILVALSRIGNNVNQIANRLNTSGLFRCDEILIEIRNELRQIRELVAGC